MTNQKIFAIYWEAFSKAFEENEIELSNLLIEKIESIIDFKNETIHNHWLQLSQGFKFWEDFEEITFKIVYGSYNPKKKKEASFEYEGNDYILTELIDPINRNTYDIISIFKCHTYIMDGFTEEKEITLTEAKAKENEIYKNGKSLLTKYEYINYFYCQNEDIEDLKELAINYILKANQ